MAEPPARRRSTDAEIVAVVVQVILDEGTVASQTRLAELVNRQLKRRGARVTPERLRVLAVRSGLVGLTIRTRTDGPTPEMEKCPVCRAKLRRTANRTLTAFDEAGASSTPSRAPRGATAGQTAQTGYKCTKCPWWTGRELRIPQHYTFTAKVSRSGRAGQLSFL